MNFAQAVEAYAYRTYPGWFRDMEAAGWSFHTFNVTHEEGWSNDSGTNWPASTTITFRKTKVGPYGQRHTRKGELGAQESDPVEFMRALFEVQP